MTTVERKRMIAAPPEVILPILSDVDNLRRLVPQAERVEVLQRGEGRARIAISIRIGKLGRQRVEGEARLHEDGLRFIAVVPTQIDIRWTIRAATGGSEVGVRASADLAKMLGPFARLVPNQIIERQVGDQIDHSLDALQGLVTPAASPS